MKILLLPFFACALGISGTSLAQDDLQPDDEYSKQTVIGYTSVQEALESLKAKPGVSVVTKRDGWIIATEPKVYAQWSFTPSGHYAHPAVVRRIIQQQPGGEIYFEIAALCGSNKVSCDRLMTEFRERNASLSGKGRGGEVQ